MTTYYKATFSDGTVLTRSTASRTYSHAWLVKGECHGYDAAYWNGPWQVDGFSRNEQLARKEAAARRPSEHRAIVLAETAPAIEITGQEYRRLNKPAPIDQRAADKIDGYDRDDLGESPDF